MGASAQLWVAEKCSFYWGKINFQQATILLQEKPDGTYLIRDSCNTDYMYAVTYRLNGATYNRKIGHRKDVGLEDCMFGVTSSGCLCCVLFLFAGDFGSSWPNFMDSLLTTPLRHQVSICLKDIASASICTHVEIQNIDLLVLPSYLKAYLKDFKKNKT